MNGHAELDAQLHTGLPFRVETQRLLELLMLQAECPTGAACDGTCICPSATHKCTGGICKVRHRILWEIPPCEESRRPFSHLPWVQPVLSVPGHALTTCTLHSTTPLAGAVHKRVR